MHIIIIIVWLATFHCVAP